MWHVRGSSIVESNKNVLFEDFLNCFLFKARVEFWQSKLTQSGHINNRKLCKNSTVLQKLNKNDFNYCSGLKEGD